MSVLHITPDSHVLVHAAAAAVLYLHIGAGTVALLAGAAAFVFRKGSRLHRQSGNVFVVGVADCQASFNAALRAGGAEALPVTDMPGVGIMAYVKDPDGNVFGMIAPTMPPQG